jgi:hypothetical protein
MARIKPSQPERPSVINKRTRAANIIQADMIRVIQRYFLPVLVLRNKGMDMEISEASSMLNMLLFCR